MPLSSATGASQFDMEDGETDSLLPLYAATGRSSLHDDEFDSRELGGQSDASARFSSASSASIETVDRPVHLSFHIHLTVRVCLYLAAATLLLTLAVMLLRQPVSTPAANPAAAAASVEVAAVAAGAVATAAAAATVFPAASTSAAVPSPPDGLHPLYARWLPFCNSTQQNIVLHRNDAENYNGNVEQERPWSVNQLTFQSDPPHCTSTQQLLDALHYGRRHPLPGYEMEAASGRERARVEWARSWFEPAGCSLRWYESDEICGIFDRFSHVVMAGDSLSRHVDQALYMLLTEDLRYGGLPRLSRQPGLFDKCQCDGQFSEHSTCRDYEWNNMHDNPDPRIYGVCTHTSHNKFTLLTLQTYEGFYPDGSFQLLCSDDPRPRFVLMQGHAHFRSELQETVRRFINPLLESITAVRNSCPHRFPLHLVWGSATAQSRLLDVQFPHQSREQVANYNREMETEMARHGIVSMWYWNMTADAATSDGFHYLTDVNLVRANSIINYLALLNTTAMMSTT